MPSRILAFASAVSLTIVAFVAQPAVAATFDVVAPPSLANAADRIRRVDRARLAQDLARAGLAAPDDIRVELVADDDPRAAGVPRWIVGFAAGSSDIVIFPDRVLSYPYDSLESVVRHEITHLALSARAGSMPLPRWFHEGVAVSVDAGWDVSSRLQLLVALRGNTGLAQLGRLFASGTGSESALAYRLAAALVSDLRRQYGADVPGAIAARVARGAAFEEAFAASTGRSPEAAATDAWAPYRRWTSWISALANDAVPWGVILALACAAFLVRRRQRARRRARWAEEDDVIAPPE